MYFIRENGSKMATHGYTNEFETVEDAVEFLEEYIANEYPINVYDNTYDITREITLLSFQAKADVSLQLTAASQISHGDLERARAICS